LTYFINNRSYDEIYTQTNENIWSEIYLDAGIEKEVFVPRMIKEWDLYWHQLYLHIKDKIGITVHLDEIKDKSWRDLQTFIQIYNDTGILLSNCHGNWVTRNYIPWR
jgi:predicted RNA-binding protein (virulence factor B family)